MLEKDKKNPSLSVWYALVVMDVRYAIVLVYVVNECNNVIKHHSDTLYIYKNKSTFRNER